METTASPARTTTHRVAVIPGDGIGTEVVPAALRVLDLAAGRHGFSFEWDHHDWGCEHYRHTGRMMPEDGLERLADADAIFLGAVGHPSVPDHVSLWGLLVPIRRAFHQYVNLRPVRLLPGIRTPLAGRSAADLDLVIVRENNEGEYSRIGGRIYEGTEDEIVIQDAVFTRRGVERVMDYAFDLARRRRGVLASATKSNGIVHTMPFWDEVLAAKAAAYPGVEVSQYHVDALAARLVLDPGHFDVVVASNLFGDILSDLAAAIAGSIGIAPSANLQPERHHPSMFEPVHGSAPDIAGTGVANPVGQVWSGVLLLEHLGHPEAAAEVMGAVERVLAGGEVRTPDLGGRSTTEEVTVAIVEALDGAGAVTGRAGRA